MCSLSINLPPLLHCNCILREALKVRPNPNQEIIKLTDWYTDDLFLFEDSIVVKADFSRIFCDTERFSDDSQEVMAKYGMGVLI